MPSLRQAARAASNKENNLINFCNNVFVAHKSGAFGGKPALWDFMRDVAGNLNKGNKENRYFENTKAFSQAMKIYGDRRMCDLFALNVAGPNYKTIQKKNKKKCAICSWRTS